MPKVVLKDVLPCLGHASWLMLNCRYLLNKIMLENAKQPTAYMFLSYRTIIQHFTGIQAYIMPTYSLHGAYMEPTRRIPVIFFSRAVTSQFRHVTAHAQKWLIRRQIKLIQCRISCSHTRISCSRIRISPTPSTM